MNPDDLKRAAAAQALELIKPGMRIGLGTGSTARHLVELLGEKVRRGLDIVAVPTSEATRVDAERAGIPLTTLEDASSLDLTIDGADEIAPDLSVIKGGGGALLREKIVAAASSRLIIIADETKWVDMLGRFPLPIEVVPFGVAPTQRALELIVAEVGCSATARLRRTREGHPFVTDGGHLILDMALGRIPEPQALASRLSEIPGVVEHGLFIGLVRTAIIAGAEGVRIREA